MKRIMSKYELPDSALKYVLESLVPYTDANLKLSFSPNTFFSDLERAEWQKRINVRRPTKYRKYHKQSIRKAFYDAKQRGFIVYENDTPKLSKKGRKALKPYQPKYLGDRSCVIVTFDIPERQRHKRSTFRLLLKELKFEQVQQSVWKSQYNHIRLLKNESKNLGIRSCVHIYESVRIDS